MTDFGGDWTKYNLAIPAEYFQYNRCKDKKAYLFCMPQESLQPKRDVWIPKSQVEGWHQKDKKINFKCPFKIIKENLLEGYIDSSAEPSLFDTAMDDLDKMSNLAKESEILAEDFHHKSGVVAGKIEFYDEWKRAGFEPPEESLRDAIARSKQK